MRKLLNLKWDKRTAFNILKFPFIITVRTPLVIFFLLIEKINDWSDIVYEYLPGWKS